jgi:hypothetical protein
MKDTQIWIAVLINIAFLYFALRLAIKTNLIKDDSIQPDKPYSYGKSQLFWWTVIIISEFIWCAVANDGGMPKLNTLCLALLGISAGTTAAGALIDNSDKNTPSLERHQDVHSYSSFIKDILSDAQGNYSIHRFQSLIFNLAIGIIFLWNFFNSDKLSFPTFEGNNQYILGLLGISNLGYAGLKLGENAPRKDAVGVLQSQGKPDAEVADEMKLKAK